MTGRGRRPFVVVVAGTGTEVGKTWLACQLAGAFRSRGLAVAARKPAQSFSPDETGHTDAELLARATGQAPRDVCPPWRWYLPPWTTYQRCGITHASMNIWPWSSKSTPQGLLVPSANFSKIFFCG